PVLGYVRLQELAIRVELDGEQVRHLEDARTLAKILADALFLGEGISHCDHPLPAGTAADAVRLPETIESKSTKGDCRPADNTHRPAPRAKGLGPRIAVT